VRAVLAGSPALLTALRELVSRRGDEVVEAADGGAVVAALARGPTPDVVAVTADDEVAAIALVRAARSHVRGEGAALLALVPEAAVDGALGAGADFAMALPLSPATLASALRSLERWQEARQAAGRAGETDSDLFFRRNPSPMWFFDVDTLEFVAVNDAAVQKYGYSREEFLAMTLKEIRPPEELARLLQVTSQVAPGLERTRGWRHRSKDGRIFPIEIISYPVRFQGRSCELVLAHDVSERVEAEQRLEELRAQLAVSDRMASIGTLAAGVAHEINNPLTWILANLTFAVEALAEGTDPDLGAVREALAEAGDGARRVRTIVRDLRGFSRADDEKLGPVDLARDAAATLNLAANELTHRARAVVSLAGLPPVLGNEARLGQVLLNLVVNAIHAIPEGDVAGNEIRIAGSVTGDRVALTVSDTGSGVDPALADRIFEPFFTTKPLGEGTGLGLWVCRRIAQSLGGTLELQPAREQGAAFRLVLPMAPTLAEAPRAAPPARAPVGRRPRVLVVDDEPLVGRSIRRALASTAEVVLDGSSRAALERLARGERFDLVLSDVMMPELPGADFHAALEARHPDVARSIVYMTGGAFSPREREFLERVPNVRFEKPVDIAALRELVLSRAG
jgi:PAS domain S-box-containing protein